MRKILVDVASVAGLLAVALALASSPAAAAMDVVTITSASQTGVYTVTWSTKGGCDPGASTSGAIGAVTLTVVSDGTLDTDTDNDGTPDADLQGSSVETGVVIDDVCTYEWKASLVKPGGSRCKIVAPAPSNSKASLTYVPANCNSVERVTFFVAGHATADELCTSDDVRDAQLGDACEGGIADTTVKVKGVGLSELDKAAVKETTFTVTAIEKVAAGAKSDPDCATVSGETKVGDAGGNAVELALTDGTLSGTNCRYTVTASLPAGFDVGVKGGNGAEIVMGGPGPTNRATLGGRGDGIAPLGVLLTVTVATRKVYLVQNVIGDAGGATAAYKYDAPCGAPGLPPALGARADTGGIQSTTPVTFVELREGRFNVSAGIGGTSADGRAAAALDKNARACVATVSISDVPDDCASDASHSANLADAGSTVILEFTVDCTPRPEPERPADDGDNMMGDSNDMTGPPADVATG